MEHAHLAPVGTFFAPGPWGSHVELDEAAAHHARVKRLSAGDTVRLTGGDGRRGLAEICELASRRFVVSPHEDSVVQAVRPIAVELWAPVGDRERMLLLAEKAVELGVSVWRPIVYRRSRSVNPRGEGEAFREKIRLRMVSALEQSGGAWLPERFSEVEMTEALTAVGAGGMNVLLDVDGTKPGTLSRSVSAPVRLAVGPEGGLEAGERDAFSQAGWRTVSLGHNVLRFETAAIASLAIVRALCQEAT